MSRIQRTIIVSHLNEDFKIMNRIMHPSFQHIEAGRTIDNGYPGGYCTAPLEPGFYTLYEIADDNNCHLGWEWEKENE